MGGISVMVMLSVMGALAFVILGAVAIALAAFIAATAVSIVFACRTKSRHEQGKKLKGLLAIPIVLYAISIPVLVWFAVAWVIPLATDVEGDEFPDFTRAVSQHDPEALQGCFDAHAFEFPAEGDESLPSLLEAAITYDDAACAQLVLEVAGARGMPIDVNEPLPSYTLKGEPYAAEYALVRAAGPDFRSARMIEVLLEAGADPNASSLRDLEGSHPLHLVCGGASLFGMTEDTAERVLGEVDGAIDALLAHGADPAALNAEGRTPGECYRAWIDGLVDDGLITCDRADQAIAAHPGLL
ncbi:hypothetical protein [Arabiibacter massiliensis]|uniref:hypothetical protein n=1 Tax=Arabiibacter massiliensis TaxID=1870985 RepID=UPI0009BA6D2C|nr:hypothetical protein [Arabiibacter massiliensis]